MQRAPALVVQPGVLQRHCRVVAEGAQQRHVVPGERPLLPVGRDQRAEEPVARDQRNPEHQHCYVFVVHALDVETIDVPADSTPAFLGFTMARHILGRAVLTATAETSA